MCFFVFLVNKHNQEEIVTNNNIFGPPHTADLLSIANKCTLNE